MPSPRRMRTDDAGIVDVAIAGDEIAMPGIAFGRRKTALGVHHADIEKFRHLDPLDQRALARQRFQRALEGLRHRLIEIVERDRGRHRQPHALDRTRLQRRDRLIGQHRVEHRAAGDRARQRPKTVERERQRHAAVERHAPLRRLEADDAVIGRRNPAGAAGVGAERAMGHADRRRRPPHPTTIRRAHGRRCASRRPSACRNAD